MSTGLGNWFTAFEQEMIPFDVLAEVARTAERIQQEAHGDCEEDILECNKRECWCDHLQEAYAECGVEFDDLGKYIPEDDELDL